MHHDWRRFPRVHSLSSVEQFSCKKGFLLAHVVPLHLQSSVELDCQPNMPIFSKENKTLRPVDPDQVPLLGQTIRLRGMDLRQNIDQAHLSATNFNRNLHGWNKYWTSWKLDISKAILLLSITHCPARWSILSVWDKLGQSELLSPQLL